MNKVICDICGTTYPETASQCPICGCAKPGNASVVSIDALNDEGISGGSYTYVKGGRFSNSNVRKRNKSDNVNKKNTNVAYKKRSEKAPKPKSDRGLWITLILLLLAIGAVLAYMYFTFFAPAGKDDSKTPPASINTSASATDQSTATTESTSQTEETNVSQPIEIKCTELTLSTQKIELDAVGNAWLLNVTATPADTTDMVSFSSSDEAVASVTEQGRVTAVGPGNAVITVVCGDITAQCNVVCDFVVASTESTQETEPNDDPVVNPSTDPSEDPSDSTQSNDDWGMNRTDISFRKAGEKWDLYKGTVSKNKISWYSQDESVATVKNGVVTAVGAGTTKVYAEYNGQKVSCVIRCKFSTDSNDSSKPETDQSTSSNETYTINKTDVTIGKGETFSLTLTNSSGTVVSAGWVASESGICTISGNSITGAGAGRTTVSVTIGGKTYSCIVRVVDDGAVG